MQLLEKNEGHKTHLGTQRNGWEVWEDQNGEIFVKMEVYYNGETQHTYFDYDDLPKVLYREDGKTFITWWLSKNRYISSRYNGYLHHLIMGNNKVKGKTVDHIDRNTLNNRRKNLRWATPLEQTHNSRGVIRGTKKKRRENAQSLPDGLREEDIPQYICYKTRKSAAGTVLNYFRIYCHPLQKEGYTRVKQWSTPQTMKMTIMEKLERAKEKLAEMDEEWAKIKNLREG